jgi:hypothetical protein
MSTTTTDKKIIIKNTSLAWLLKIKYTPATGVVGDVGYVAATYELEKKYTFDNLADGKWTIKQVAADSTSGENIDFNTADGRIIRFDKDQLILAGKDETDITPAATSTDATGLAEIILTINEAPKEAAINGWTAFIADLKENIDAIWCVVIGTGYSYYNHNVSSDKKPDGYAFMFGKISGDIASTIPLVLTFASNKAIGLATGVLSTVGTIVSGLFDTIAIKRGGAGNFPAVAPTKLSVIGEGKLLEGNIVFDDMVTYTYT